MKALIVLLLLARASVADAQQANDRRDISAERLRLSLNRLGVIDVESAAVLPHLSFDTGLWLGYAGSPLSVYRDGARVGALVQGRLGGSVFGTIGLFDWIELGLEVPLVLFQFRPSTAPEIAVAPLAALSAAGFGDPRIAPKVQILRTDRHGVDLGVLLSFTFPVSGGREYLGESGVTFAPEVLLSRRIGGLILATNLGILLRNARVFLDQRVEDEVSYRFGAGYRFKVPFGVDLSLSGAFSMLRPFRDANQNALEARTEINYAFGPALVFAGGGLGLLHGWGTPDYRAFLGVRVGLFAPPPVPASAPVIVSEAAPVNPDHDGDNVPDVVDGCPNEAGPAANAGCPDRDRDGDTLVDRLDNCPDEPGPLNFHGCQARQLAVLEVGRITITESVHFDIAQDTIKPDSFALLDNVARVLIAHPEITHLRVEGHTDSEGEATTNLALSQARSQAVARYLSGKGVASERLVAQGFGEERSIASNDTAKGRAQNRRVEFIIVDGQGR